MINVDLKTEGLKATESAIDTAVKKTIYSITSRVKEELKEEASYKLKIKRPWVLQGFWSRVERHGPRDYRSTLWHRSGFMKKHEDGDNILARSNGEFLIPKPTLREASSTFKGRRAWLKKQKAFRIGDGLFISQKKEPHQVGSFSHEAKYKELTEFREIAKKVIEDEAQELFRGYLRIV